MRAVLFFLPVLFFCFVSESIFAFEGQTHTYATLLVSKDSKKIRLAAKSIYNDEYKNIELLDLGAEVLWLGSSGKLTIMPDSLSWLAKTLGNSQLVRYQGLLEKSLELESNSKVKKYIKVALKKLSDSSHGRFTAGQISFDALTVQLQQKVAKDQGRRNSTSFYQLRGGDPISAVYIKLGLPDSLSIATGIMRLRVFNPYVRRIAYDTLQFNYENIGSIVFYRDNALGTGWRIDLFKASLGSIKTPAGLKHALSTANPTQLRDVANRLSAINMNSTANLDLVAKRIWQSKSTKDKHLIEALGMLCQVITKSNNPRYRTILEDISKNARHGKLRKHAKQSLKSLPSSDSPQFLIAKTNQ